MVGGLGVKRRVNLSCTLHLSIILLLATRCQLLGVNLKVPLAVNSASKLEGESGSKLEGALFLGTRCYYMNTSSENMKSFQVWPLDVSHQGGGKLEGASGSKLEGYSGRKLVGSKLASALLLDTRCHCMNTSSENMKSFWVWPLDVTCRGVNLKVTLVVNLQVTLAVAVNLKVTLAVAVNLKVTGSKLEGDSGSGSKLEGDCQ